MQDSLDATAPLRFVEDLHVSNRTIRLRDRSACRIRIDGSTAKDGTHALLRLEFREQAIPLPGCLDLLEKFVGWEEDNYSIGDEVAEIGEERA